MFNVYNVSCKFLLHYNIALTISFFCTAKSALLSGKICVKIFSILHFVYFFIQNTERTIGNLWIIVHLRHHFKVHRVYK